MPRGPLAAVWLPIQSVRQHGHHPAGVALDLPHGAGSIHPDLRVGIGQRFVQGRQGGFRLIPQLTES